MVKRIVANIHTKDIAKAEAFYKNVLGLDPLMDHGWIATYGLENRKMNVQISFASEGGSGTLVPDLSIEVDDFEETLKRTKEAGFAIEYGPVVEPWGVKRFYTRDPFGKLINILCHVNFTNNIAHDD
jgi:catechol 2,3-dioxygenase-like lactoylglutathione lyase family enzyme